MLPENGGGSVAHDTNAGDHHDTIVRHVKRADNMLRRAEHALDGRERKLLVGLHTDTRAAFLTSKLNPMILVPLDRVTEDEKELIDLLRNLKGNG